MFKKSLLLTAISVGVLSFPSYAQAIGVNELQDLPSNNQKVVNQEQVLKSDSYAYKTLKNLSGKYGLLVDIPQSKFNGTDSLSRNEAALILVNLMGKIEKDKVQLSEVDKERLDALNDQLKQEIGLLTARVNKVETSVGALQENVGTLEGRVTNLEDSDSQKPTFSYGDKLKIGGMFRGEFSSSIQNREGHDTRANFNVPIGMISISGKPMDHTSYFVLLNPNYKNLVVSDSRIVDEREILDRAFVQTDIIPHHKISFGKQVVPILDITSKFYSELDTTDYFPQIGNIGVDRQTGLKISGDYKYLNYQAGMFARSVADENNAGMAYIARAGIKPLVDTKYGDLELGGSYYHSDKNTTMGPLSVIPSSYYDYLPDRSTNAFSAYAKYKIKDLQLTSEFLHQSNIIDTSTLTSINPFDVLRPLFGSINPALLAYLPATDVRTTDVTGWYAQALYNLTPKMELVGRFDTMSNDRDSLGLGQQYLAGVNYYLKYPNLKLMTNYIVQDLKGQKVNNKFVIQTQFLF